MGEVFDLQARAQRSRKSGFKTPVVADAEQALATAKRIAEELAGLSGDEALLGRASLQDVQAVLAERVDKLHEQMAETGRELQQLNDAARVRRLYARRGTTTD